MSLTKLTKLSKKYGDGYTPWSRPTDWLALTTPTVGDQRIVALAFVNPNSTQNLFAITIAGAYTVDWGDGTAVQNVATGVATTHNYNPANLSSSTLTSDGWLQAIVTITMQASNTLTSVAMSATPTGATAGYIQQWREIKMVGASVNSLTIGAPSGAVPTSAIYWFTYVGPSNLTGATFQIAVNLRGITGTTWTHNFTSMANMFLNCTTLESVPLFDTSSCTTFLSMFSGCIRIRTVPLFVTSSVLTMASMFVGCSNLQSVPLFDTSAVTTMSGMFQNCVSLTTIPLFNTGAVTSMSSMFSGCSSLASIPALNTQNVTTMTQMFNNCSSLTTLPASLNTVKVTDFSTMFNSCVSLASHPTLTMTAAQLCVNMFAGCISLPTINLTGSSLVTSFNGILNGTIAIQSVTLDMTSVNSTAGATLWTTSNIPAGITTMILTGLRFTPGTNCVNGEQMNATALNNLYSSLGTASGAQTLTVTTNPGKAGSNTTIATAKGWTVV